MKKKYYVGFFTGIFLLAIILGIGYQLSYRHTMNRQEAKSEQEKTTESVTTKGDATKNEGYYICELHGYVVVYLYDKTTVYEVTSILVSDLPEDVQKEVKSGKYVEKESEVYGFLENYSS
ncbi:hypothetical protein [Muricomes intestini]|jgi:hypothetical protein|uniref:Bypass of forespore C C-terminal domain-containing protein n=1 Tax=Muricomes intestini TaxID=1796634 RepID=A0A4R3KHH0_9FIRM|nr:hypothetical protein [Muricomes intestini]TCS82864.1 hypothetical protein EDD59_101275 [Muricomes intestini]HCR84049.1 hypothetical protein [Lachnospiraceae bacterium]